MEKQAQQRTVSLAQEFGFDTDNFHVAHAIAALIQPLIDKSTSVDSGGGAESADIWATIGGIDYYIKICKSNAQRSKEAQA